MVIKTIQPGMSGSRDEITGSPINFLEAEAINCWERLVAWSESGPASLNVDDGI
jgi:hypothetical protein